MTGPVVWGIGLALAGFGIAGWVLRWEIRHWLRERRRGGFLIGGDR